MAARATKHVHDWRVISHTEDWDRVLVSCAFLSCGKTEALMTKRGVKPAVSDMKHLCCA